MDWVKHDKDDVTLELVKETIEKHGTHEKRSGENERQSECIYFDVEGG